MSDDGDSANEASRARSEPENGIFGKLPDSRPGTRSPRRRTAGGEAKSPPAARKASSSGAAPRAGSRPAPKPQPAADAARVAAASEPDSRRRPASTTAGPAEERSAGLEDIAWAGVAAAAEAATMGVRLATKAIEALRGTSERP